MQKLTKIISGETFVPPETAVSPIKTKREKLFHVWVARNRKAARTRARLAAARQAMTEKDERGRDAA